MKKTTKLKLLKIGMIVSGTLTNIIAISDFILKQFIKMPFKVEISGNEAVSIGIIGGADGPTAIFLAENQSFPDKYVWILIFSGLTGFCFLLWRRALNSVRK